MRAGPGSEAGPLYDLGCGPALSGLSLPTCAMGVLVLASFSPDPFSTPPALILGTPGEGLNLGEGVFLEPKELEGAGGRCMCCPLLWPARSRWIHPQLTWRKSPRIYFFLNGVIHHASFAASTHSQFLPAATAG